MANPPVSEAQTRGRPRSEAAHKAILEATRTLLETTTIRDLTIEAIARTAGVGKTTIYRRWPSKSAVVIDALEGIVSRSQLIASKSVRAALSDQVSHLVEQYRGRRGRIVAELLAEGQADSEVLNEFRERFLLRRRAVARELIEHGKETGEFDPQLNTDLACDVIFGPIYYRLMVAHLPLDDEFANALPRQVFVALQHAGAYGVTPTSVDPCPPNPEGGKS